MLCIDAVSSTMLEINIWNNEEEKGNKMKKKIKKRRWWWWRGNHSARLTCDANVLQSYIRSISIREIHISWMWTLFAGQPQAFHSATRAICSHKWETVRCLRIKLKRFRVSTSTLAIFSLFINVYIQMITANMIQYIIHSAESIAILTVDNNNVWID